METCEVWAGVVRDGNYVPCGEPAVARITADNTAETMPVCAAHAAKLSRA